MSDEIQQKPPLIDSVPGIERSAELSEAQTEVAPDLADTAMRANVVSMPVDESRVVHISPEDFKGNPTKVIGHPSNPNNDVIAAFTTKN
jgi:hypothetical protein